MAVVMIYACADSHRPMGEVCFPPSRFLGFINLFFLCTMGCFTCYSPLSVLLPWPKAFFLFFPRSTRAWWCFCPAASFQVPGGPWDNEKWFVTPEGEWFPGFPKISPWWCGCCHDCCLFHQPLETSSHHPQAQKVWENHIPCTDFYFI